MGTPDLMALFCRARGIPSNCFQVRNEEERRTVREELSCLPDFLASMMSSEPNEGFQLGPGC